MGKSLLGLLTGFSLKRREESVADVTGNGSDPLPGTIHETDDCVLTLYPTNGFSHKRSSVIEVLRRVDRTAIYVTSHTNQNAVVVYRGGNPVEVVRMTPVTIASRDYHMLEILKEPLGYQNGHAHAVFQDIVKKI